MSVCDEADVIRYAASFQRPSAPFAPDGSTVGLYHFDEGRADVVLDSSPYGTHGERRFGGNPAGPLWVSDDPF